MLSSKTKVKARWNLKLARVDMNSHTKCKGYCGSKRVLKSIQMGRNCCCTANTTGKCGFTSLLKMELSYCYELVWWDSLESVENPVVSLTAENWFLSA